jgi:malonyl-CoA decarboxylase
VESSFLNGLLQSVSDRGRALLGLTRMEPMTPPEMLQQAEALLSGRGEATGVALAQDFLARYAGLTPSGRTDVLIGINDRFGPDLTKLDAALQAYRTNPGRKAAGRLHQASEPRRQELIRRLNLAPGGTHALVKMREDLLARLKEFPDLNALDQDFIHLFSSWFNRGFLVLRRIDWSTPANILEKIIHYEAVHAIESWDDLRRRLEPSDRRLYAFFHPALVDEPLIFVEVALMPDIPDAISPLLAKAQQTLAASALKTAVFYSISNAQTGLAGVSFGNFLIKQVVEELKREVPQLATFVTLSPVPGFAKWLAREKADQTSEILSSVDREALSALDQSDWHPDASVPERLKPALLSAATQYFLVARDDKGRAVDPVARFHLGNGARLERINLDGDLSPKGRQQSYGLMVNYLYDLDSIESNHEAYANRGEVMASTKVRRGIKMQKPKRSPLDVFATKTG